MFNFKNKSHNINNLNALYLNKLLSMFKYYGLPKSIPQNELEKIILVNGQALISEVEGVLYAFKTTSGGSLDVYGNPVKYNVSNAYINHVKTYDENDTFTIFKNDHNKIGVMPIIDKGNTLLNEIDISLKLQILNSRKTQTISASDEVTKKSAEEYLKKLYEGEETIIGEDSFFDGVKVHGTGNNQTSKNALTETSQLIKSNMAQELGISSNSNVKRERLNTKEVESDEDMLYPLVDSMLESRLESVELLNAAFGLNVKVELSGIWKKRREGVKENETE